MSLLATTAATGVSLAALGRLAARDPKRRRVFGLEPVDRRHRRLLWLLVWAPGLVVPVASGGAGLVIWLGLVSVAGWIVAALPPGRLSGWVARGREALPWPAASLGRLRPWLARARRWVADRLGGFPRPAGAGAATPSLEERLRHLEAEVAALKRQIARNFGPAAEDGNGGIVVELSGRR